MNNKQEVKVQTWGPDVGKPNTEETRVWHRSTGALAEGCGNAV